MNPITRILLSLSLLAALASCTTKPQADPAKPAAPATSAKSDSPENGDDGNSDSTAEKPKTPFRSTRMRLPDMEGLPSHEDLSPVSPADSGGAVIARPPVE